MAHPYITPTKSPSDEVISAYNCVEFCFTISDYITTVGNESFLEIEVSATIPAGQTLNLYGQQFLFTNNANNNGLNIAPSVVSRFEQRDFIFNTLQTNYNLIKNFDVIKFDVDRIRITAKKKGVDFDIDFSSSANDLVAVTDTDGVNTDVYQTYKIIGCLQIRQNDKWVTFDEIVRDVVLVKDEDGNFVSEVCYKLHSYLKKYFTNMKPNLDATYSYIDIGASFEFRFGVVDFKAQTGEVGDAGFFDNGNENIYCVINGRHKLQDNDIRMTPYYEPLTNGLILPLNQINNTIELCCDNNGFMSVFVRDKDLEGWGVLVIGEVFFESSLIEQNYIYGGMSGVGSDVVIIPVGPRQLDICNDFLGKGIVTGYNYQAIIFNDNSGLGGIVPNLFLDGNGGTFESNINNITSIPNINLSQVSTGYVGNGLGLTGFLNATLDSVSTLLMTHTTIISFEVGNVYFIEARIRLKGLVCECLTNLFVDGNFGTFDGQNPITGIDTIAGLNLSTVGGLYDDSLLIDGFGTLVVGSSYFMLNGSTNIAIEPFNTYVMTAWVKVIGLDCFDCIGNLFVDGDKGRFNSFTPPDGIIPLAGITIGSDDGLNATDGLLLSALDSATISNGAQLFRGDTSINFEAGQDYSVTMYVKVSGFNCLLFNLFADGDYGSFESDIANIVSPPTNSVLGQAVGLGRLGGNAALVSNVSAMILGVNSTLIMGNTPIAFNNGVTYELSCWVNLKGVGLTNACSSVNGVELEVCIVDALSIGDITINSSTNAVYNSSTCATNSDWIELKFNFTVNNPIAAKRVGVRIVSGQTILEPIGQEIYFDDIILTSDDSPAREIRLNAGLTSPIGVNGTEIINDDLVLDISCNSLDVWTKIDTTIQATNNFSGKVSLIATGSYTSLLEDANVQIVVDDILVLQDSSINTNLRLNSIGAPLGMVTNFNRLLDFGYNCSDLNNWVKLETEFQLAATGGNIKFGLEVLGNVTCFNEDGVNVLVDNVQITKEGSEGLDFKIGVSSGGHVNLSNANIKDCSDIDKWFYLNSVYIPSVTSNKTVEITAHDKVYCLGADASTAIEIDNVVVLGHHFASGDLTTIQNVTMVDDGVPCNCSDDDCCNEEFTYKNELGTWDYIHFECITSNGVKVSRTDVKVCQDCDDDISEQGDETIAVKSTDTFIINTRVNSENEAQFKIFLGSIEQFHVVDNKLYPIKILNNEEILSRINANSIDIDVEFEYQFDNPTLNN